MRRSLENVFTLCEDQKTSREIAESAFRHIADECNGFGLDQRKGENCIRFVKRRRHPLGEGERDFSFVTLLPGGMAATYILRIKRKRKETP